jgi:hypothetical protein
MAYLRCETAFFKVLRGSEVAVHVGDIVADDDPVVRGSEEHFRPIGEVARSFARKPEQATAAPGEQRSLTLPKRGPGRPRKDG